MFTCVMRGRFGGTLLLCLYASLFAPVSRATEGTYGEIRTTDYGTEPTFGGSYFWRGYAFKLEQETVVTHLIGGGRTAYSPSREFRGALLEASVNAAGNPIVGAVLRDVLFPDANVNQVVEIDEITLASDTWYFIAQGSVRGTVLHWYVQQLNAADLVSASERISDWYPIAADRSVRWLGGNHGSDELASRNTDLIEQKPALGFRYLSSANRPEVETSTTPLEGRLLDSRDSPTALYIQYGTNSTLATGSQLNLAMTNALAPPIIPFSTTAFNLLPDTVYYYRARAINDAGSANGAILSFTTPGAPAAPTITAIESGNSLLRVFVTAPGTINNYQYSLDNGLTWITRFPASAASPIEIGGLMNGVTYTVRVRAVAQGVVGPQSNSMSGTPTGDQSIGFPAIPPQLNTNIVDLVATASSGLPVSFAVLSGPGQLSGGTTLSFTGTGTVSVVAHQAGNASWNPAPPVTNSFPVTLANLIPLLNGAAFHYGWYSRISEYQIRAWFIFKEPLQPEEGPLKMRRLWLDTPDDQTHELFHYTNQTVFGSNVLFQQSSLTWDGDDIPSDGEYTLHLEYADEGVKQTMFRFFVPGTTNALIAPTQNPVILQPPTSKAKYTTTVEFVWRAVTDINVTFINLISAGRAWTLPRETTAYGPVELPFGEQSVEVWFMHGYQGLHSGEGVPYQIGKGRSRVHTFEMINDTEFTLTYYPNMGGILIGNTGQTVFFGQDGEPVGAEPELGAVFGGWSDGSMANPRTDLNVTNDLFVSVWFKSPAGVPLSWYEQFGLFPGPSETWSDVDARDSDADGSSNADEFYANTDPTNPDDALSIYSMSRFPIVTVQFISSTNRLYKLRSTYDLDAGLWFDIGGTFPRPGIGGPDSLSDPTPPPYPHYYRIEALLP